MVKCKKVKRANVSREYCLVVDSLIKINPFRCQELNRLTKKGIKCVTRWTNQNAIGHQTDGLRIVKAYGTKCLLRLSTDHYKH